MKLKLKNFKCYTEKEFDFGINGILLLSGSSGTGKTTILNAINFILYGSGNKIITYGKNSCSTELILENMNIIRTKRPNTLKLNYNNIVYEDDAAQSIINEHFGNSFDIISYAQQNNLNSFINLGPTEKLIFLEKIAFNGLDIDSIKNKCSDNIKKQNEQLIYITSQLELANNQLNKLTKPKKIEFPIKTKNIENAIINEPIRLKNTKILIKKCLNNIEITNENLNLIKINNIEYKNLQEKNDNLKSQLGSKKIELLNNKYIGHEEFKKLENKIKNFNEYNKYIKDKNKYEEEIKLKNKYEEEIKDIIKVLWNDYSKEESETMINDYIIAKNDFQKIKEFQNKIIKYSYDDSIYNKNKIQLAEIQNKIEQNEKVLSMLNLEKEIYICPNCNINLSLKHDESKSVLECSKYQNFEEIEEQFKNILNENILLKNKETNLKHSIKKIESDKTMYENINNNILEINNKYQNIVFENIEDDLKYIQDYLHKNISYEKEKNKIERNLKILQKDIIQPQFNNQYENFILNDDIKEEYIIQKQLQKEYLKLNEDIENIEKDIDKINKNSIILQNEDDVASELIEYKKELKLLSEKEMLHENNLIKINQYKRYIEDLKKYNESKEMVKQLEQNEKEQQNKYSAAMKLKEKILESESLAIANIIESINIHCQYYLDIFFPTDPIIIKLLAFKETKKNSKPQINIEINYKDMETDLNMLSGGELSRVSLAFILGLSEIFNSKIILLDECTSSLDQELTNIVIDGIRKNFSDKLVIIIAHQVVSGVFDKEIKL